ncbi:MAG: hypothetical protein FJ088_08700, partial [Deltaproteobacteria bacterium]|nr:hypothetical protein [Deltaproteobacteria bacterium]
GELSRHDEPARINVNLPEGVSLEEAMLLAVVNRVLTDDSAGAKELRGLATEIGLVLSLRERTDIEAAKDNPALFPLKFKDPSGEWAFIKDSRDRLLGVPWEPGGFSSYSSRNVLRKTFKGIADDKVPSGLKMKQLWRACEFKRESDEFSVGLAKEGYLEIEGEIVPTELSRHPLPDYQTILNEVQRIEKAKEIQKNVTVALLQKLVANASSHKTEIYDVKSQLQWLHNSVATQTGALQNLIQEISQLKSPIHDRKQPSHDSKLYDRVKAIEIWSKEVATAISDLRREQGSLLDQIKVPAAGGMSASGAPQPLDATELKTQGIKIGKLQSRLERLGKDSSGGDSASISKTLESIEIKLSGIDERIRKIEDGEPDRSQEYVRAVGKLTEKFEELERKVNSATHPSDKPPETPKATPPSDWWAGCIRENVDKTNAELPYIGVLKDLQSRLSTKLPANATVGIKQLSIIGRNIVKLEEAHPNPGPDTEAKHFLVVDLKDNGNSLSVFVPPHRFKTVSYPAVFRHLIEQPSGDYSLILRPAILIERQADNVWEIVEKMQLA